MNLRGIVAVSGRPGLFQLIGQNKAGYVLEGLDAQKLKIVANLATTKLASLEDITIYGEDAELKLADVLMSMASHQDIPDSKADGHALRAFFDTVAPNHDREKVYTSDIKKIITWFNILKDLPIFTEPSPDQGAAVNTPIIEDKPEVKSKTSKAKPSAAKAPTTKASAPAKKANMTAKKGV